MPLIDVTIPRMLAELVHGARTLSVEADSVGGALEATCARHPELRVHLFDESGELRPNVSCFHNDRNAHDLDRPAADGDRVVILQAVSGG